MPIVTSIQGCQLMNKSITNRLFNAFRNKKKQVADPFLVSEFEARQREFELQTDQMLRRVAEVESQETSVKEHLIQIDLLQHRVQDALQEFSLHLWEFLAQHLLWAVCLFMA
jgi:hypothetical protein